jgi:hypothetical protein
VEQRYPCDTKLSTYFARSTVKQSMASSFLSVEQYLTTTATYIHRCFHKVLIQLSFQWWRRSKQNEDKVAYRRRLTNEERVVNKYMSFQYCYAIFNAHGLEMGVLLIKRECWSLLQDLIVPTDSQFCGNERRYSTTLSFFDKNFLISLTIWENTAATQSTWNFGIESSALGLTKTRRMQTNVVSA